MLGSLVQSEFDLLVLSGESVNVALQLFVHLLELAELLVDDFDLGILFVHLLVLPHGLPLDLLHGHPHLVNDTLHILGAGVLLLQTGRLLLDDRLLSPEPGLQILPFGLVLGPAGLQRVESQGMLGADVLDALFQELVLLALLLQV